MFIFKFISTFVLLVITANLIAGDLKPPIDIPSAKTLPKGVRNVRYKLAMAQGTDYYNNSGEAAPLGNKITSPITVEKAIDGESDPLERGRLYGFLHGKGYNDDDILGHVSGDVKVAANVHVPIIALGISKKLTTAVAIPIVQSKTSVDTGYISNSTIVEIKNKLRKDVSEDEIEKLVRNINRPVDKKLEDYGYDPLEDEEKTELGDIKLVSKYKLKERDTYAISLTNELTLPTGQEVPIDKAFGVASGDGQWDVGFGLVADYYLTDRLTFSQSVGFIAQLPDKTSKRIPRRGDTLLSPDIENDVERDLGDILYAQVAASYNVYGAIYAKTGYSLQYKGRDQYSGSHFLGSRYNWLEVNTEQNMQSVIAGLGLSTVELYKRKRAIIPAEANLTYSTVVVGKNVVKNPLVSFELVMFF